EARRDPDVADDVQLVANENRRRRERRAAIESPGHVRLGHVARAVRAYRKQRWLLETGRDVDESVPEHGTRHVREPIIVADAPDLLARAWIIGRGPECADADDLVPI